MDNTQGTPENEPKKPRINNKKRDALIIIGLAVVSFTAGFILVHYTVPKPPKANVNQISTEQPLTITAVTEAAHNDDADEDDEDYTAESINESLQIQVPPGPIPEGVRIDGPPFYHKCWLDEKSSSETKCDRQRILERRMATRLYIIDECRTEHAKNELGLLSLGTNLDLISETITFWSGPSSTIKNAKAIGNCVRERLAQLPITGLKHKAQRYRLFFTIDFFDAQERQKKIEAKKSQGRKVKVTMDRVNIREEPVTGASQGRISTGAEVTLLKRNQDNSWCNIITASNVEGWMICEALGL